jgi:hypothetical protein
MRTHLPDVALLLVLTTFTQACATTHPSVFGRDVRVVPRVNGPTVRGELLVVEPNRVVVLAEDGLHHVATAQIREIRVRRHGFDAGKAWMWTLVGAFLSSVGLAAACSSVEDGADCAGVAAAGALPWLVIGGLSSLAAGRSAFVSFDATQEDRLRPFARYPQGLPAEFDLQRLGKPARAPR